MKICFKRSGGLAAIFMSVTLDTEMLPKTEAESLCRLIDAVSFFDQPDLFKSHKPEADRFHYQVKIEVDDRAKTIEIDESVIPEVFRPLIDYLLEMARKKIKGGF